MNDKKQNQEDEKLQKPKKEVSEEEFEKTFKMLCRQKKEYDKEQAEKKKK